MSINKYLATKENIEYVGKTSWKLARPVMIDKGMKYYEEHPEEVSSIVRNLDYMGMVSSGTALDEVLKGISLHYYEKLFILTKTFEAYWIAKNRIEISDNFSCFQEAKDAGKSVFIAQSHFGASYMMAITMMVHGFDIYSVAKFPEPIASMIQNGSKTISERYKTGKSHMINIADPKIDVPQEMFKAIFSKEILSNVFDENNEFCSQVSMMGKPLMGGSGMDQMLKSFNDEKMTVVTPFIVRTSDEAFRFELDIHTLSSDNIINDFFASLEKRIKQYPDQWYFIHELHESFV